VVVSFTLWHSLMRPPSTADNSALVNLDDNALAAELMRGQSEALVVLFDRYRSPVFRIARRIVKDYSEAEDVVQQVFLETYQHISQFDAQKRSFRSWLLKLAQLRAIDWRRHLHSQHIHEWLELDEEGTAELRPAPTMLKMPQQEIECLVDELLQLLSDREKQVIELSFVSGLTLREIQEETNVTLPVVRHLYYETLRKLRSAL
jgi:RNA polymerase sigma-70 factor (ECF subfamily)